MAQTVKILLEDDIEGGEAAETVRFGLDNTQYEIDLNADNAQTLRESLRPYVAAARKATGRGATTPRANRTNPETKAIREWARTNGYQVADRGRIDAAISQAYHDMKANRPYPSPEDLAARAAENESTESKATEKETAEAQ